MLANGALSSWTFLGDDKTFYIIKTMRNSSIGGGKVHLNIFRAHREDQGKYNIQGKREHEDEQNGFSSCPSKEVVIIFIGLGLYSKFKENIKDKRGPFRSNF